MILNDFWGCVRPKTQKGCTFCHFLLSTSLFMKHWKSRKTRKCTLFCFLGGKWPPRGGWKPLPAAMFSMFSWLWRHFPPQISFLVELWTSSPFSWKGPGIRTFRWKGGPCRPTPPKPLCFVSEFQCFARPEKIWKTQNLWFSWFSWIFTKNLKSWEKSENQRFY